MSEVQTVFIARHGERQDLVDRDWHRTAESPGDPPLTETGQQQAHQLGIRLQDENIRHIYASPFLRTVQTAHQVAAVLNLPVKIEYGLSEGLLKKLFPYGQPEMLSLSKLKEQMPLVSLEECSYCGQLPFPEQYAGVKQRVLRSTQEILRRHPRDNILLVGHGLSVEYMARAILPHHKVGQVSARTDIPYCSLTECTRQLGTDAWDVVKLWDDSFLRQRQDREDAEAQRKLWGL